MSQSSLPSPTRIYSAYAHQTLKCGRTEGKIPQICFEHCGALRNASPKGIHVLVPGTWEYVAMYDKGVFADVMKLRILRWGDYSGLSEWAQCNHKRPYEQEVGGSKAEKAK